MDCSFVDKYCFQITAAYTSLKDPEPRSTYDIKHRELLQRWHPTKAGAIPTSSTTACRDSGTEAGQYKRATTTTPGTTTRGSNTSTKSAAAELRSTAFTGTSPTATTAPNPATYHWNSPRADRYHRALQLERKGHLKRAEARQLQNLIEQQVSVGSDRWYAKMKTVEALREEAEMLFSKAKRLNNEAAGLDTDSGKVKRARKDNAEAKAKRSRM
jgi:hypothetical protein